MYYDYTIRVKYFGKFILGFGGLLPLKMFGEFEGQTGLAIKNPRSITPGAQNKIETNELFFNNQT
jgi:hypothetical protein